MKYPMLPFPCKRDQVIMEIILNSVSSMAEIQSLNRCQGMLQCIFLSDLVTADERYLESFVFNPGPIKRCSNYRFPRECPTKRDPQLQTINEKHETQRNMESFMRHMV
jgi:hypothetical protein